MNSKYTLKEKQLIQIEKETENFLRRRDYDYLVTLTFKREVSEEKASQVFTKFIKITNIACFGRRSRKSIVVAPVIEKNMGGECHIHFFLQDPRKRSRTRRDLDLKQAIRDSWNKASSSTADVYKSSAGTDEWFKEIYCQQGAAYYLTKQIHWGSLDSIDYANYTGRYRGETPALAYSD